MDTFDSNISYRDLPTNREFYEQFNKKAEELGLPTLIITSDAVYKDELHAYLGIGIKLEN